VNTLLAMLTAAAGAYMHTALPLEAPTLPANVHLSTVDVSVSATAPPSMAVLLAKVQPLSAAAAAAYTAPPIAVIVWSVGVFRKLHKKQEWHETGQRVSADVHCERTGALADSLQCHERD
jgi:hypothetical protein